jgi:VWFA-related protein
MFKSKFLVYILIFSFSGIPVLSQDYQVTVSAVHVWVKAIGNDGQPVTGLTMEDFEIYEDGKKVPITCFEEHMITESAAPTAKPVQILSKKFVVFLDLFNTSRRQWLTIRPHLAEFINSLANGQNEIMLAALMPTRRMGIISPFTRDVNRIRILLGKAQAGADRDQEVQRNLAELSRIVASGDGVIEKGEVELVDLVKDAHRLARTYAKREQEISEYTLQAVQKFAEHMGTMNLGDDPVVVYVSGGFSVDPGRVYYDAVADLASSATTTEEFAALAEVQELNLDIRREIRHTLGKLNKMNVTFYTIDTGGLGGEREYQDSLVEIANETGGTAFYNSQNFNVGLYQIMTDLSHQYLLCYSPPPHPKAGEYHTIKVVVRPPLQPGRTMKSIANLRHRKGYTD